MKDYAVFSVKDFVMDEYFQSWVFNPVENSNAFWQSWMQEYSDKRREIEEARSILLRLNFSRHDLPAQDVSHLWNQIRKVDRSRQSTGKDINAQTTCSGIAPWRPTLVMGFMAFFWQSTETTDRTSTPHTVKRKVLFFLIALPLS